MAKLLAYADCSIQVLANKDPRLCDCNKITDIDIPVAPDQPDKQKDISLKADWKYLGEDQVSLQPVSILASQLIHPNFASPVFSARGGDVFRPPQA